MVLIPSGGAPFEKSTKGLLLPPAQTPEALSRRNLQCLHDLRNFDGTDSRQAAEKFGRTQTGLHAVWVYPRHGKDVYGRPLTIAEIALDGRPSTTSRYRCLRRRHAINFRHGRSTHISEAPLQ
jgi:hypothetical protein